MPSQYPKRVYIAGHLGRADDARWLAAKLRAEDHQVVSTWHSDDEFAPEKELSEAALEEICQRCDAEVMRANAMVFLCDAGGRGSLVELGLGYARGCKPVVLVGDLRQVTCMARLPHARRVETLAQAVEVLR